MTAVQGWNGSTTGDASFEYTLKSPSISNVNVTNTLDIKHTVYLYCYGKSYRNRWLYDWRIQFTKGRT